ncbi:hypothetical protein [Streptomyces sp. NBC_01408]|uniref:hypothetical protein n=1 Tax=Streptomyces sp. NBC_01408 TaxID=2903855 RepID=UPI002250F83E|nr:hypothetical protein [Streptomyces sp. NBC_01408]MCX4694367.1 hypothetical protein [Streptomyces sp. NBC_01408]
MTRIRGPLALFLLLTAMACLTVGAMGSADGALVLAAEATGHPLLLGWLSLGTLGGAALLGLRAGGPRRGAIVALGVTAVLLAFASPFLLLLGGAGEESLRLSAPGRDDRRLVVAEGAVIDPVWYVYVHQGTWPLERRWRVGSFDGDAGELREAVWTAPDRIRVTTADGTVHEVAVTPGGRPGGPFRSQH